MRVWLVQTGEPLPIDGRPVRPLRTALLARALVAQGHDVVWWASAFDHATKTHVGHGAARADSRLGGECILLRSRGYARNVGVARLIDQVQVAVDFARRCAAEQPPDVIHCGMPTIELCHRVGHYAHARRIPFVVDVRDLWPDIFMRGRGRLFRTVSAAPMWAFSALLNSTLRAATALTAVSDGYLEWGLRRGGRTRTNADRVFPHAYDSSALDSQPNQETAAWISSLRLAPGRLICCFVGTLGRTYNVSTVIAAAEILNQSEDGRFHFVICGKGDEEAVLRTRCAGLSNVTMTGWIDEPKIAALMRISSIGLAAYASDAPQGVPNKIGEYACGGLAIVSSLGGEAGRLLARHEAGVHYDADRPGDLVDALVRLANDREQLQRLQRNAGRLFAAQFDATSTYDRMAAYVTGFAHCRP